MVESNLNSMQTLVVYFRTETSPIFFFEEETALGIHIENEHFRESRRVTGDFPNDLIYGITLIFVFTVSIKYQNTADVEAPILRVIVRKA